MHHNIAIGIMDEAYFMPRQELIKWINASLNLNVQQIQDLGTGAVYCQLIDYAFGQRISMQKVNWKAKFEYEFISNFKVFQNSLEKLGISKKIDIEKLAKAKYQDNLELIQWLKRYIELNGNISSEYHPEERRGYAQLYSITQEKKVLGNTFKANTSFSGNSSMFMNQSMVLTTTKSKPIAKSKNISNKENDVCRTTKVSSSKLVQQMQSIKSILHSSNNSDRKIHEIEKIVFGHQAPLENNMDKSNMMEEEEDLVF